MPHTEQIVWLAAAPVLAFALAYVVRLRHRSHVQETADLADEEVCGHLRPVLDLLRARGSRVTRVGQRHPDLPLEIHVAPPFDPQQVHDELKLADPVFVSERRVLYCKEDFCEIHPKP